jgi:hypothetical protein
MIFANAGEDAGFWPGKKDKDNTASQVLVRIRNVNTAGFVNKK